MMPLAMVCSNMVVETIDIVRQSEGLFGVAMTEVALGLVV